MSNNTKDHPGWRLETYPEMVHRLFKTSDDATKMTAENYGLLHLGIAIPGEAGEIADAIKKHVVYGKELDKANLVEEIGDMLFYLTELAGTIGVTLEACAEANRHKLYKRYPNGYTNEAAIARADKLPQFPVPRFETTGPAPESFGDFLVP